VPLTTVSDYLRRATAADLKWPLPGGLEDAGLAVLLYPPAAPSVVTRPVPDWQRVHTELRRKGVTLQLLWVEYREAHPDGYGYSQFANLYRAWRGQVDVTMRQSHVAGEKLFVDFPGDTVPVWDRRTGEISLRAELFVAVLGASSWLYAEAFPSPELLYWVTAHVHCFGAMAGCPAIVVCGNLRSGVTRPHRYEPGINATSFPGQPSAGSLFGRPGQGVSLQSGQTATEGLQVACVNPAAIGGGLGVTADLVPYFPASPPVSTPWVTYPDLYSADYSSAGGATWLQVSHLTVAGRPVVSETLGAEWGYHIDDINLALGNLVDDVTAEDAAYTSQH
jgi:hypothetical protein